MPVEIRDLLAGHPGLHLRLARLRHRDRVVRSSTDLVIEGFPRSANTFAVAAFEMAQPQPVRVAHHVHTAEHVLAARRMGIPVLLLIRNPRDAIVSSVLRKPGLRIDEVAGRYEGFYGALLPVADELQIATFEGVTTDMGDVIDRVNTRYGTTFRRFAHTDENVERCFDVLGDLQQRRRGAGQVAAPEADEQLRLAALARYDTEIPSSTRMANDRLYATYAELAASRPLARGARSL